MNIDSLREFAVFSRYLNFSKASASLNMAQPTLSGHISNMEKELGFKLVIREHPIRLTLAGKRFCTNIERLLAVYDHTVAICKKMDAEAGLLVLERPIRVNGFGTAVNRLLIEFKKACPGIDVKWVRHTDKLLSDVLSDGKADAGFVTNVETASIADKNSIPLESTLINDIDLGDFYIWTHKDHPLANRELLSVKDLDGCIFLIPSSVSYAPLEKLAKVASKQSGISITCSFWPGDYEDCIFNIASDEIMLVSDQERSECAYDLVDDRVFAKIAGLENIIEPVMVFNGKNENPALKMLQTFLSNNA